ncbi:MAG: hypothetical protein Q4E94_03345, partial [Clostridia bacterium]|nr:hypothetical protein [Clostridia bacterium]
QGSERIFFEQKNEAKRTLKSSKSLDIGLPKSGGLYPTFFGKRRSKGVSGYFSNRKMKQSGL